MIVIVAQAVLLTGSVVGLALFVYANVFIFKRLLASDEIISRRESIDIATLPTVAAAPQTAVSTQMVIIDANPRSTEETLFLLYQEQLRRFIDAKIDIMRSTSETQNRVMLLQAQAMCNATNHAVPLAIESLPRPSVGTSTLPTIAPYQAEAEEGAMEPARRHVLGALMEHHETIRDETRRQLEEIDLQMRNLPGPSMAGWVMANAHHCIN